MGKSDKRKVRIDKRKSGNKTSPDPDPIPV